MGKIIKDYWVNASKITRILFWVLLIVGVTFMIISFILPPTGQIDNSVILAFGEIQTFASIGVGLSCIDKGMNLKFSHGDTEVELQKHQQ